MPRGLEGKVAIVTGGAQSLGKAAAETLAGYGVKVAIADINIDGAEATAAIIRENGGQAMAVETDVSEEEQVKAMTDAVVAAYGPIEILYNNAAILDADMRDHDRDVASMRVDIWDKAMAVNLRGAMLCSKYALKSMISQKSGSIIFATSGLGVMGDATRSAYAASKAGVIMLSKSIATQYGELGIRSNAIQIGFVLGDNAEKNTPQEIKDILLANHLTPYLGSPQHIADVVAFLASDEAAFVTGHTLAADGGFTAHTPSLTAMKEFFRKIGTNKM
ncbi:MAG: short-chain dehydrogenase [Roseovarius sp.]|nr:short-chain dehydrogenase [Roseovarius sp.]|tara:strand:+ start:2396 stop:3223 length:828 start_codon:yes stop_codon:yes gene_type:complete